MLAAPNRASVISYARFPDELDRDWLGRACHLSEADLALVGVSLTKLPGTAIRGIPPGQRTAAAALRCSRQRPTRKTISVVTSSNSRVCGS